MPIRSRSWIFVINNYTPSDIANVMYLATIKYGEKNIFLVCGYEVGEQGTPHIQGYVYFKEARTRKAVSQDLPRSHLEPAQGTPDDNIRYIVGPYKDPKSGKTKPVNLDVIVYGKKPSQGKASFAKVEEAMIDPKNHIHLYTQYRKAYKEIKAIEPIKDKVRIPTWCSYADKYCLAKQCKANVCFYDGTNYNGETVVFIHMSCVAELPPKYRKIEDKYYDMIDQWRNGFPPLIKNGYEMIRFDPDHIFVVSDNIDLFNKKFH